MVKPEPEPVSAREEEARRIVADAHAYDEAEGTFWNGEPCEARRVVVVVADNPAIPQYWARQLVGTRRDAVEVRYAGTTFYLDDQGYDVSEEVKRLLEAHGMEARDRVGYNGWGWDKVTKGHGGPRVGHANITVERVVGERVIDRESGELKVVPDAWGHKLAISVYLEGEYDEHTIKRMTAAVEDAVPSAEFVGMSVEVVQEKPTDQGGS